MELFDTTLELNIIPEYSEIKEEVTTRCLNMCLKGIGGQCTSIAGLEELIPITIFNEEETNIHPFVEEEAAYTVLGISFLADNEIRLKISSTTEGNIQLYRARWKKTILTNLLSPEGSMQRRTTSRNRNICSSLAKRVEKITSKTQIKLQKSSKIIKQFSPSM
ncbi:hypothetical protein O181_102389 [Austropuccinia psidii MF-1]|uniref:Uncharacterized protein n=1 Tax=Austropuccinia psidii MF-1 TaxID=1389203 RepID=A0A9Q3JJ39_9BASI|nr:hypothetical protein [Austropuccinia psidii MF-1]